MPRGPRAKRRGAGFKEHSGRASASAWWKSSAGRGHSSPATTSRIYAHALPSEELAAAERWEEIRRKKATETEATAGGQITKEEKCQDIRDPGQKLLH